MTVLISWKILLEIHCRSLGEERPTLKQAKNLIAQIPNPR